MDDLKRVELHVAGCPGPWAKRGVDRCASDKPAGTCRAALGDDRDQPGRRRGSHTILSGPRGSIAGACHCQKISLLSLPGDSKLIDIRPAPGNLTAHEKKGVRPRGRGH